MEKFFKSLKENLVENKNNLIEANKIDLKYNKNKIDFDRLIGIINLYEKLPQEQIKLDKGAGEKYIFYTGDPYLTLNLLLQSFVKNVKINLIYDDYMVGINMVLAKIFEECLADFKIKDLFTIKEKITNEFLEEVNETNAKVFVIGMPFIFEKLKCKRKAYYPYNNYLLYCDDEELEDLKSAMFMYTEEMGYELEIIYEDLDIAIEEANSIPTADSFILLTNNEETKKRVKKEVKDKKIYINENPFKKVEGEICFYI